VNQSRSITDAELSGLCSEALQDANEAFKDQVSNQISRVTAELKRMEDLLKFGMVDRRVLSEFRTAIDKVRSTGWQVERWLDHDGRGLDVLLTEERIRVVTKMATQLAAEPDIFKPGRPGLRALKDAIDKLVGTLQETE
jgi:hypothetical protein